MAKANAFNEEEAAGIITIEEGGNIKVVSFTKDDIFYDIIISQEKKEMMSCSCSDQQQSDACCKHVYLVNRATGLPLLTKANHQQFLLDSRAAAAVAIDETTKELDGINAERVLAEAMEGLKQAQDLLNSFMAGATQRQFSDRSVPHINRARTDIVNAVSVLKGWQFNPTGAEQNQRRF
ncbi:hypothetical protein HPULCUR_009020 [Helicostylum pulchrum]|uniref:SWIM-type domain-containing protein n=1 Tax=Helicostylum pulchrum TaxID=562976 RepID=A0ABP9Y9I2_9FUNG